MNKTDLNHMFYQTLATFKDSNSHQNFIAILIIMFFFVINLASVLRYYSVTTDEDKHYLYGERVISGNSDRFDDSKMPISALNAIPAKIASYLDEGRLQYYLNKFYVARTVTIFFSCILAFLVFYWSRSLYGFIPGLFSLLLYILDPNIIAHSQLVTTDLYATTAIVFSLFLLWRFANHRSLSNGLFCAFMLGVSQLTKYTAIILYPLFFITLVLHDIPLWKKAIGFRQELKLLVISYVKYIFVALLFSLILVNVGFLFNRTFTRFGDYNLNSELLKSLQSKLPVVDKFIVPVPYPYLQGLDMMIDTEQSGKFAGNVYLLGKISTLNGFAGYYFIASLLKVPIGTQIIYIAAFTVYFFRKRYKNSFRENELFIFVPICFFAIYLNFFFNTQVGIRYYLPVFPFLYIFSGVLFEKWDQFSKNSKLMTCLVFLYIAGSVFSYYPYCLSYMNEFVWDRRSGYKYLSDSNLDWEQARNELKQYLAEHPGALINPGGARAGYFVVRISDLTGVTKDPDKYAWLRDNFEPVETIAYSYLVYRISEEEFNNLCASTSYCR